MNIKEQIIKLQGRLIDQNKRVAGLRFVNVSGDHQLFEPFTPRTAEVCAKLGEQNPAHYLVFANAINEVVVVARPTAPIIRF